jgi:two-component system, NarL family, sensor histidine kinase UhpB
MKNNLDESKKLNSFLFQNLPEALYTCDQKGHITQFNNAAANLWGREPVIDKDLWCTLGKIYVKAGGDYAEHFCNQEDPQNECMPVYGEEMLLERPDGSKKIIKIFPSDMHTETGHLKGTVNMLMDVTEEKIIEKEDKYRNLVEQAAVGIFLFDPEGNFISANTNGCLMLGYDKQSLLSLNIRDIIPPRYRGKEFIKLSTLYTGKPLIIDRQYMRKDGTVFFTEVNAQLTSEGNIQAIVRDITESRTAKENMQKAIDRYDILAKATSDTIWDWDIVNNTMLYNEGIKNMFGYEKSEVHNVVNWWKEKIYPDDYLLVAETIRDLFERKLTMAKMEYRFYCADHTYKYIYDRAYVIYDENEKPIRMIGAMQNVTYEKQEENRIAKAIIDAQEQERRHIGQELHDNVNQILAGSLLTLGMAKLDINEPAKAIEYIDITSGHLTHAIDEIRKLSHQLVPVSFEDGSLVDIFENLLLKVNLNNRFDITLHFDDICKNRISYEIQINLYRILQEAIKNILKYSEATSIEISVKEHPKHLRMRIYDNGKGFDVKSTVKGIGISNMNKRAQFFSGKFLLISAPGKGCELIVEIPLH